MVQAFDASEQIALLEMMEVSRLMVNAILRRAEYAQLEELALQWSAFRALINEDEAESC